MIWAIALNSGSFICGCVKTLRLITNDFLNYVNQKIYSINLISVLDLILLESKWVTELAKMFLSFLSILSVINTWLTIYYVIFGSNILCYYKIRC